MERETVLWRIGYAGCSEGPYRLSEVFERLKERRWSGEVLVYARGRTEGWVPMDTVPEFLPLVAELRKIYMGQSGSLQWKASEDRFDRGVDHEVWTEEQSQLSVVSQADTWVKGGIELQEQSFGFLDSPAPPPPPSDEILHEAFLPPPPRIAAAPVPQMKPPPPKRQGGFVPEGTNLPGFHSGFKVQVPVPEAARPAAKSISTFTMDASPPPGSPVTRIITAPPSQPGIVVLEDGHSAFLSRDSIQPPSPPPGTQAAPRAAQSAIEVPLLRTNPPVESPAPAVVHPSNANPSPGNDLYATRYLDAPPSIPGIEVSEEGLDAFLN